jgi:hypothetical protein
MKVEIVLFAHLKKCLLGKVEKWTAVKFKIGLLGTPLTSK